MQRSQESKGFTLIEIVVALGILTIGIVSVLSLFPVGLDSGRKAKDYTDASLLATYKMADIVYNLDDSVDDPSYIGDFVDIGNNNFTWYYTRNAEVASTLFRIDLRIYSVESATDPLLRVMTYVRTKET